MRLLKKLSPLLLCLFFGYSAPAEDWPKYRHDLSNTGVSGESGISSSNVASLKLRWAVNTGFMISGSPAVATINGTSMVFDGTWGGTFYAVNAVTGAVIWTFTIPASDLTSPCTPGACRIASSPAVSNNIVYFGAENAFLYALNAANGAVVWKQQLEDSSQGFEIWSSPAVFNGNVYVGLASHGDNPCVQGEVEVRNAANGAHVWTFQTIDPTSCPSGTCVGAGVWSSPAIDTSNNVVYVGTGNPGSTCSPATANATRYPDSILQLNASTGQLLGFFQAISNDNRDLDFGSSAFLYETSNFNQCTNTNITTFFVGEASKNGQLYSCNRSTHLSCSGTLLDGSEIIGSPAVQHFLVSGRCGRLPGPIGIFALGFNRIFTTTTGGSLYDNGSKIYNIAATSFSAPAVIQDVVFFGATGAPQFRAVSITGTLLWSFTTGGSVNSGPAISNGRVYVGSDDHFLRCFSINGQ
jgi:outer membrane protein assembly factor BamB